MGEVLRRLTLKCVSRVVYGDAVKFLTPLQLGVGISVGCEAIIHAVTSVQEDPTIQARRTIDGYFCSISPMLLIALVTRRCLEKLGFVSQPWLHGWSAVMGPNPFCTSALISSIVAAEFSRETHLVPWVSLLPSILLSRGLCERCLVSLSMHGIYLDNGILCGSACDLIAALEIIEEVGPARGLFLSRGKSLLHIPTDCTPDYNPLPAEIPIARDGFDLLGSPVVPSSFCEATVLRWVRKVQDILH